MGQHRGKGPFGRAYQHMFDHDVHPPGSADWAMVENMVLVCSETARELYRPPDHAPYKRGTRPALETRLAAMRGDASDPEAVAAAVAAGCAAMVRAVEQAPEVPLDEMRFGGTEEEIAERGSNWCTDMARLACRLYQVAGLPARIATLADTAAAYSGHQIVEVRRNGAWGAVDPTTGVVYTHPDRRPATTWDLQRDPALIQRHNRGSATPYTNPGQFRAAAITEYPLDAPWPCPVVGVNPYYRSILEMVDRGWPGGLRWLHGEDRP